jgi:serine/threonine protein kinase
LHSRNHLHLDVKPSNIIASDGVARLIDLSLARRPGRCAPGIGTPGYMSPEQVCGGHLGPPADVWGVGLVLYEAATGLQPFDLPDRSCSASGYTSTMARCQAVLTRPAPKVRARRRLPTDVAEIIDACLRWEPDQRPTLEQLGAALATLTEAR